MPPLRNLFNSENAIRKAIELNPDFYFYWCKLGNILKQKHQLDDSINAYYHALELNPSSSYCLYKIGEILIDQGKFMEAIEFHKKAITSNPNIYHFYEKILKNFINQNQLIEAFVCYFSLVNCSLLSVNEQLELANNRQILLITGQMRSGTTLLANLLNSQSSITIYRDFLHIQRLMKSIGIQSLDETLSPEQYLQLVKLFANQTSKISGQNYLEINTKNMTKPPGIETSLDFYLCVIGFLSKQSKNSKIIGHKSTVSHLVISGMLKLLPNLKVIYIIRDPRDVLTSSVKFVGARINIIDLIEQWKDAFNTIHQLSNDNSIAERLLILRYEDLLIHKEDMLIVIAQFLGLEKIEIPETLHDYGNIWHGNSSFAENLQVLDKSRIGQWKCINPVASLAENLLCDEMVKAGYEILKSD